MIETYYAAALAAIFGAAAGVAAVAGRKTPGTPKAYVVTEVDVTGDMATFQRDYAAHAKATIEPFGGRYLVRGGRSTGIEGEPPRPRIVISVFDSFEQAQAWRNSPEYVKIAAVRKHEARSRQYIVEGLPEQGAGSPDRAPALAGASSGTSPSTETNLSPGRTGTC